jgi:hypothetical protein
MPISVVKVQETTPEKAGATAAKGHFYLANYSNRQKRVLTDVSLLFKDGGRREE